MQGTLEPPRPKSDDQYINRLRDEFAGVALSQLIAHESNKHALYPERLASAAYIMADAMMEARLKT